MKKYYKIPMTERIIKVDGTSLFDILKDNYPDLYNREKGRVELQYGGSNPGVMTPQLEEVVGEYNKETDMLYKLQGVPKYIIAINNGETIKEYVTGKSLESIGGGCIFQGREVSQKEAYDYLDNTENYAEIVGKLLVKEDKKTLKKTLVQRVTNILKSKKDN
jgi:hypothetical protein